MRNINKAILVATAVLCLNFQAFAQNISLKANDITIKEAIEQLKESSGYSFVFSSSDLNTNKRISVSATNSDINSVVKQILQGQPSLTYEIQGNKIIVKKENNLKQSGYQINVKGKVVDINGEPIIG